MQWPTRDEKENFTELRRFQTTVAEPQIAEFGGNIFKETAELVLANFDNVVKAARCAAGLRDTVAQMNQTLPDEQRIAMRIGINLGDVIIEDGDVFGDGVNIAAPVGALAKPGSVYVSETVHNQVAGEVEFDFEDLGAQNGLSAGSNVYASNPAAVPPTPFPLNSATTPTLLQVLSNLTPLAFISSQKASPTLPTLVPLYDANANTFLYAVTVSRQNAHAPPGGTVPDTLYLFYDDLSQTTQNFKNGNVVAKFSFPLTVLNSDGSERAVPTTLNFTATNAGDCSASTVSGNFSGGGTQTPMASQIGINCQVVFGASPTASGRHAIFELAIPLVATGACQNPVRPGFCLSGQTAPGPNTDPAYFYGLHHPNPSPPPSELAGQINLGLFTAFLVDDLGSTPTQSNILPAGASIGIAPTAGPLGSPPISRSGAVFALCASLPSANGNGQAPLPSVAAYYAIAVNGEALLSASFLSTSACPAL
jgi:hypothetical protein